METVKCEDCVFFVSHSKRKGKRQGECRFEFPPYMHPYTVDVSSEDGCHLGISKDNPSKSDHYRLLLTAGQEAK